ncbi:MAG: hypothetical protein M1840_003890 [Geoglossum simile]|nr:MAG: hypothetical protein M1840_003890 [Geoglossum simile]
MPPSCEGSVRSRSFSGAESGSNCSSFLPSYQNGAHSPIDGESDNGMMGRTEPYPLDAGEFRRPDPQHQPDGSSAARDSFGDGKDYIMDANSTIKPEFAGEFPDPNPPKKRKLKTAEALAPENDVAFQSPSSQDQSKPNKRLKIDRAGGTITVSDVDVKPFRGASGRLPLDKSRIPPEIWHYVFGFIPPEDLARLLRVSQAFNKFLTPPTNDSIQLPTVVGQNTELQTLEADSIWSASRKLFYSDLPRPPLSMSELDMWKLLCGRACQFCGKPSPPVASNPVENQFEPGPGEDGVKIIWQFGVRSCGTCLQERSEKEISVLVSSSFPSPLLPALPFILLTPNLHVITSTLLQNSSLPPTLRMTKHFYKPHIEDIKRRFEEVMALGNAAGEEWFKGLDDVGKERMSDSMRFERWEARGGLKGLLLPVPQSTNTTALQALEHHDNAKQSSIVHVSGSSSTSARGNQSIVEFRSPSVHRGTPSIPPRLATSPVSTGHGHPSQGYQKHSRVERTIQEVNERKAIRRLEIERRCLEFSPPLEPAVLNHIEAFQAALQISTPLTDQAWEVLKPRILAQREAAERREKERVLQSQLYQQKFEERRQIEAKVKEAKEVMDREWDEVQQPIRDRIGRYAEEKIKDKWKGGELITKDNSPNFAADVLIHVRQRFYAHIARDDIATRAAGEEPRRDHPDAPPTRKLILENMKWVFDTKIKPLTEHYRKELFLCSGCHDNFKFYGFEGVIQHYAAKHTNALSSGAVVVHWRAEWPEQQPFHPDPSSAKASFYALPSPALGPPQLTMGPQGMGMAFPSYTQEPVSGAYMAPHGPSGFTQFSPGPHGHPQYPGRHPTHPHGPYAPPQGFQGPEAFQGPPGLHGPPAVLQGPQPGFSGPQPAYQGFQGPPQGYHAYPPQYLGQPLQTYNTPSPNTPYGQPISASQPSGTPVYRAKAGPYGQPLLSGPHYSHIYQQANPAPGGPLQNIASSIGQSSEIYKIQLEEMATIARETWFATSGIKDLPGSVRISVVIHHVVSNFTTKFANEPSLAMFMDGLSNHIAMKPIRSVNGLACKACVSSSDGISNGHSGAFPSRPRHVSFGDRKPIFTLPTLLVHFQTSHIERAKPPIVPQGGITTPRLDWKEDMVELPETAVISGLLRAHGMDDNKLQLLARVFPKAFPYPLPRLGPANNTGPVPVMKQEDTVQQTVEPNSRCTSAAIDTNLSRDGSRNGSYVSHLQRPRSSMQSVVPSPTGSYPPSQGPFSSLERRHPAYYVSSGPDYHENSVSRYPQLQGRRHEDRLQRIPGDRDAERYNQTPLCHGNGASEEYHAEERTHSMTTPPSAILRERFEGRYYPRGDSGGMLRGIPEYVGYERDVSPGFSHAHGSRTSPVRSPLSPPGSRDKGMGRVQAAGDGSEDGEVRGGAIATKNRASSESSFAEVNAAERFLQEFLPGDDAAEEYKRKAAEHDRRKEEKLKARWLSEQEVDKQRRKAAANETTETPSRGTDFVAGRETESSLPSRNDDAVLPLGNGDNGNPPPRDWAQRRFEYSAVDRYEQSPRQVEKSPELVDPRYIPPVTSYRSERYLTENLRRPRSRYDQYEAYRQERYRNRSISPLAARVVPQNEYYHRNAHTVGYDQLYRSRSPKRLPRQSPIGRPGPSAQPYGRSYTDDPRYLPYGQEAIYVPPRSDACSPEAVELPNSKLIRKEHSHHGPPEEDYHRGRPIYDERDQPRR